MNEEKFMQLLCTAVVGENDRVTSLLVSTDPPVQGIKSARIC
jgi:hypothetical protein